MTGKLTRFPRFLLHLFSFYTETEGLQPSRVYYRPLWNFSLWFTSLNTCWAYWNRSVSVHKVYKALVKAPAQGSGLTLINYTEFLVIEIH